MKSRVAPLQPRDFGSAGSTSEPGEGGKHSVDHLPRRGGGGLRVRRSSHPTHYDDGQWIRFDQHPRFQEESRPSNKLLAQKYHLQQYLCKTLYNWFPDSKPRDEQSLTVNIYFLVKPTESEHLVDLTSLWAQNEVRLTATLSWYLGTIEARSYYIIAY